jgi:EmrB/QacA subfamily drug resistance transporter
MLNITVVSLMLLMENMDVSIINIAIPAIATDLGLPPLDLKMAITSYLISLAIFVPISGWIADKFGTQRVLCYSIFGFTVFSICCGLSRTLPEMVVFRFLQGISGAFMMPVGRLLLLKIFGKKQLVNVFVLILMPGVLGSLLAPLVGGLIISNFNWGFIFWVNVPIGVFGLIVSYFCVDNFKEKVEHFNWWAFIWLGLFLAMASFTIDTMSYPLIIGIRIILVLLTCFCLYIYTRIEFASTNHLVQYKLFKIRTFRLCFISNIMLRIAFGGRAFVLALYLQLSLGLSTLHASYLLSFGAIGLLFGRLFVKHLLPYFGFRQLLISANIAVIITSVMYCFVTKINILAFVIIFSNSFFTSMLFILLNTLFFADVPEKSYASATSIANTAQQISSSVGVTILAFILYASNLALPHFSYWVFFVAFIFIAFTGLFLQLLLVKIRPSDGQNLIIK